MAAVREDFKGKSPFYPGQPVPVELFVGREALIERLLERGVGQVTAGKPMAFYVQGEYGIGKSSLARFTQWLAAKDQQVYGIYAALGGARTLIDMVAIIMEATLRSGIFEPQRLEKIKNWLAKYLGKQTLFGFTINFEALRQDAPNFSTPFGMLGFLTELHHHLGESEIRGLFLVLDEINGITVDPQFTHFIKGMLDTNALAPKPLPLLLMLCGVEERRREMIKKHQPIERYFDVIEVLPMTPEEVQEFYGKAFESVHVAVTDEAKQIMSYWSAGFPKIMHLIGDAAFWLDKDNLIDGQDAEEAVFLAAEEVGKKYVDQQVYRALRSKDYQSILKKIASLDPNSMAFTKKQVAIDLTETEKTKLNNFLTRMQKLQVIRKGDVAGEYLFNQRMIRLYIWLDSVEKRKRTTHSKTRAE
ncbi:MAG: AAA family ATPase [Desulfobacca sp.]|uniref:AAA family ATPase n=1 Tax=Desulfobacca sp. TaxID=2067990 RepID=UPI00404B1DB8